MCGKISAFKSVSKMELSLTGVWCDGLTSDSSIMCGDECVMMLECKRYQAT